MITVEFYDDKHKSFVPTNTKAGVARSKLPPPGDEDELIEYRVRLYRSEYYSVTAYADVIVEATSADDARDRVWDEDYFDWETSDDYEFTDSGEETIDDIEEI